MFNVTYANSGNINYTASYMNTTANCVVTYSTTYTGPLSIRLESIIITGDDDYVYTDAYMILVADYSSVFEDEVTAPMLDSLSAENFPFDDAVNLYELMGVGFLPFEFTSEDINFLNDEGIQIPLFYIEDYDVVNFTVTATDSTHLIITLQ